MGWFGPVLTQEIGYMSEADLPEPIDQARQAAALAGVITSGQSYALASQ